MKQKILHQRKSMGGVNAAKDNFSMIQKQIRILENRLDKALVKFNEAIAHNKTLRDTIDDLRRERIVFENIYRKMERELQERKQQMAQIIEVSNHAYEQRDAYQMEVAAIEQANRKEQEEFEEQMGELGRLLETELRLPTPARISTGTKVREALDVTGGARDEDMIASKGSTWSQDKVDAHTSYERVQNFEDAFNKIKAATGITDIEELVRAFIRNEDHNFSLFNYVNEQNNEVEKLEEQIQMLRAEEQKHTAESGEDVQQHKQILKELEGKLQSTESMAEKYEMRCQELTRIIEGLRRGIQSLHDKLDEGDAVEGAEANVTESNMVSYLGKVERAANVLLAEYAAVRDSLMRPPSPAADPRSPPPFGAEQSLSPSRSLASVLGAGPKVPMGQELLHVHPPKLDDYQSDDEDEDEEDDARPLTRDELKARTLNRLQRRGGQGGAKKSASKGNKKTPLGSTR